MACPSTLFDLVGSKLMFGLVGSKLMFGLVGSKPLAATGICDPSRRLHVDRGRLKPEIHTLRPNLRTRPGVQHISRYQEKVTGRCKAIQDNISQHFNVLRNTLKDISGGISSVLYKCGNCIIIVIIGFRHS